MSEVTLYHNDMSVCSAKVRMALAEKNLAWEGVHLNLRAGDTHKPEYMAINPHQLVPTLVHRGKVLIESNVICEYIDDVWTDRPLRPLDPYERARMRLWTKQLDEGVHSATATLSLCIAFRHLHRRRKPEDMMAYLDRLVDPARRARLVEVVELGMEAPIFAPAMKRLVELVANMDEALQHTSWLAGSAFSLADLAYGPYMIRLVHLGLDDILNARPRVARWAARLFERPSYQAGVEKWLNAAALDIMTQQREAAKERSRRILAEAAGR